MKIKHENLVVDLATESKRSNKNKNTVSVREGKLAAEPECQKR